MITEGSNGLVTNGPCAFPTINVESVRFQKESACIFTCGECTSCARRKMIMYVCVYGCAQ
jgi:hypothetical protein